MRSDEDPNRDDEDISLGRLERDEGTIAFVDTGREVGCDPAEEESCPPVDGEQFYDDDPVSGTPDPPYGLGEEAYDPLDQQLPPEGQELSLEDLTGERPARPDEESADERDLWDRMQTLSGQDETIGGGLGDVSEDEGRRILDALGDDAAEVLPQAPEGLSATGASSEDFRPDEDEDEDL